MYKVSKLFLFKGKIPRFLRTGIVYEFQFGVYDATYYDKTKLQFWTQKIRLLWSFDTNLKNG